MWLANCKEESKSRKYWKRKSDKQGISVFKKLNAYGVWAKHHFRVQKQGLGPAVKSRQVYDARDPSCNWIFCGRPQEQRCTPELRTCSTDVQTSWEGFKDTGKSVTYKFGLMSRSSWLYTLGYLSRLDGLWNLSMWHRANCTLLYYEWHFIDKILRVFSTFSTLLHEKSRHKLEVLRDWQVREGRLLVANASAQKAGISAHRKREFPCHQYLLMPQARFQYLLRGLVIFNKAEPWGHNKDQWSIWTLKSCHDHAILLNHYNCLA